MYQLVSAIVKPLDGDGRWRAMDIGNVPLRDLYKDFKQVAATLSHPALTKTVGFDIAPLRAELGASAYTFNEWLQLNGNKTLATTAAVPAINTRYAEFSDAVRAGYHVTPTHPTINPTANLPIGDKTDLLVTKAGADYAFIRQRVLANVNGFYHMTDQNFDGLYVVDGMKSCLHSGRNELGFLSFMKLGTLSFIAIKPEMVYKQQANQKLRYNCYIDSGQDLSQKTVMLVLGGYLHVLDPKVFFRVSASAFGIDFNNIALVDRIYESRDTLDLRGLGMESNPGNLGQIGINDLYSDAVLTKYLTMSQSFLVVLDNPDIFLDSIALKSSPFPGCYTSFIKPIYPMVAGSGQHPVYWPRKEHDRYSINVLNTWRGKRNYETVPVLKQNSVDAAQIPVEGYRNVGAQFLLIGSDV